MSKLTLLIFDNVCDVFIDIFQDLKNKKGWRNYLALGMLLKLSQLGYFRTLVGCNSSVQTVESEC